jgi:hypothetical protein
LKRSGSDVAAATHKNRGVAPLDALKTVDDKRVRCPGPVEDMAHQEDAPYVNKRKGLVIGRGIANETGIKKDEHQQTFIHTAAGADHAPAHNRLLPESSHTKTTRSLVVG